MFKLLVALLSLTGIVAINTPFEVEKTINYEENQIVDNSFRRRNYQHNEWINSYTEVTYKYETNEVNSVDDLVSGNVYRLNLVNFVGYLYNFDDNNGDFLSGYILDGQLDSFSLSDRTFDDEAVPLEFYYYFEIYESSFNIQGFLDSTTVFDVYDLTGFIDFELSNYAFYSENIDISFISSTDYNVIESVTYHQPETIIGSINEFLEEYLYSEIPYVNSMTFEVGGQSINLMTYLIILTGLAIAIGLLLLMIWFIKWLVKLIAYGWTLRG